jgi:hypothetical protein
MVVNKISLKSRTGRRLREESGQVIIFVVLALAIFLIGFVGFAVDMTNLWLHRQMAQGAADAACQAGVMDMYVRAQDGAVQPAGNFPTTGGGFNCSGANSVYSPCQYALFNGYNGAGLVPGTPSNSVEISYPGYPPGVTPPSSSLLGTMPGVIRVDVRDRVKLTFSTLITGQPTSDVHAFAECGLVQATAPIPIIVLNPSCQHPFQLSGNSNVRVIGGPKRSIQVNSTGGATGCAAATTNAANNCTATGPLIDLTQGGPDFSGSSMGVYGGPSSMPTSNLPAPGIYGSPASPIPDPHALLPIPADPGLPCMGGNPCSPGCTSSPCDVPVGVNGCPDPAGCREYAPGRYDAPIYVKDRTAIFDPGLYYIRPTAYTNANGGLSASYRGSPGSGCTPNPTGQARANLALDSNSLVRPSTAPGDGSLGVTFYLTSAVPGEYGSVFIGSNSGTRAVAAFNTSAVQCPGGTAPDPRIGMPPTFTGNVLLGPCSGPYGDPLGQSRRYLFFQDRANNDPNGQPNLQAGGGLILGGIMYFHNCRPDGLGTNCLPPTAGYNAFLDLQGAPGSHTYVLGNITTDQLVMGGGGTFSMALDPNAVFNIFKASLLR